MLGQHVFRYGQNYHSLLFCSWNFNHTQHSSSSLVTKSLMLLLCCQQWHISIAYKVDISQTVFKQLSVLKGEKSYYIVSYIFPLHWSTSGIAIQRWKAHQDIIKDSQDANGHILILNWIHLYCRKQRHGWFICSTNMKSYNFCQGYQIAVNSRLENFWRNKRGPSEGKDLERGRALVKY